MSPPAAAQAALTIAQLLGSMRGFFAQRGIASARLDAELLLASVLKQPRIYLYTHFDQLVSDAERDALRELARRRGRREPIAYILGRRPRPRRSPSSPGSRLAFFERFGLVVRAQRDNDVVEVALHQFREVVHSHPNSVIRHAVLWEVVGANLF